MKTNRWYFILGFFILSLLGGCTKQENTTQEVWQPQEESIQIGMSFDTFVLERWIKDRDVFVSTATEMGAEVNIQNANGSLEDQLKQIEYLIEKEMDVIGIIAVDTDSEEIRNLIADAKSRDIKIISYDRLMQHADVDLYISFDNQRVGEMMAEAVLDQIPEGGKIAAIYGSPTDSNITEVQKGILKVLSGQDQQLIYEAWADNWKSEYAFEYTNECLDELGSIDALICGNDGLAAMAFKALSERRAADQVCLIGQDADIDACQRIVEGNQYMTVYKPINALAKQAAQYAVALGEGKDIKPNHTIFDGTYEVPFYRLEPVAVTKENMDQEIVDSQFHFREDVYLYAE